MRTTGKVIVVVVAVLVVVAVGVLLRTQAGALFSGIDTNDVTPAVVPGAALNGLWYGSLDITRYDQQGQQTEHLTEAFYLKLTVRAGSSVTTDPADNSISGTYTTCSYTQPVKQAGLDEYDMQTGVQHDSHVNLYLFAPMYGSLSGDTLTLNGERYWPHNDFLMDKYASTLRKVNESTYLSACHILPS